MGDDPIRLCSNILRIGDHPPQVMGASVLEKQWMLTRDPGPSENPEAILVVLEILPLAMKKNQTKSEKRLKKSFGPLFSLATKHYKTHGFLFFFPFFAYPFLKLYDFFPCLIAAAIHLKSEDASRNPAHLLANSKRPSMPFFSLQPHRSLALRASHTAKGILIL